MTRLRVLLVRLAAMLGGERREAELSDEIDLHLDLLAQEHRRKGLSEEDARAAARREFGGVVQVREEFRQQQRLPAIDALMQDVHMAWRVLRRERVSTVTAMVLLSLGIGATVVMVDLLDRLLLRPPAHVSRPDHVVRLYTRPPNGHPGALITNYATMSRLAEGTREQMESIAAYTTERLGLGRGADARRLEVVVHSRAYFDVLGVKAQIGVLPGEESEVSDTAVISHALWQDAFGGTTGVIGRDLHAGKKLYTIVAVMPRGFAGIDSDPVDAWLPLDARGREIFGTEWRTGTHYFGLRMIARLRPGVSPAAAESHVSSVYNAIPHPPNTNMTALAPRIVFGELPPARSPGGNQDVSVIQWVTALACLVLFIACGNVGNLLLVSGLRRSSELALKAALGASRIRLIREIVMEAALLAVGAGIVGFGVVLTAGAIARRLWLPPVVATVSSIDGRLVAITVVVCFVTGFVLGTVPALRLTSPRLLTPGRSLHGARSSRLLDAFVGLQVALSVPLLVVASLFTLSLWHARQMDFGIDATNVAVLSLNLEEVGTPTENHFVHRRIQEQLTRLPHVAVSALVSTIPMREGFSTFTSVPAGRPDYSHPFGGPYVNAVDPEYFSVMGMRLISGRTFTPAENTEGGLPVMVVNQAMAEGYWPGESPLGKCVAVREQPCIEVIGVVANSVMWPGLAMRGMPREGPAPFYYLPLEQHRDLRDQRALLVRTRASVYDSLAILKREAQATSPTLPYIDVWAFDDVFQPELRPLRLGTIVFVALGVLGLLIATVGLAAVTAYGVARRTRELGIRLVLGAEPRALTRHVLARSLAAVGLGLVVGGLLAWGAGRGLRSVLFGVATDDARVYVGAALLLITAAAVAGYVPARRAGRVEPAVVLRTE